MTGNKLCRHGDEVECVASVDGKLVASGSKHMTVPTRRPESL